MCNDEKRKGNLISAESGGAGSSITLIGRVYKEGLSARLDKTWTRFRIKVYIENHPQSRDIINKFLPPRARPSRRRRKEKEPATHQREKGTKNILLFFLFILPWKMMEVRVGVVLLNFSFLFLLSTEKKPQVRKKNMKNWLVSPLFFLLPSFPWKFNEQSEKEKRQRWGRRWREKEKIQMWIKLCYLVRIE